MQAASDQKLTTLQFIQHALESRSKQDALKITVTGTPSLLLAEE